MPCPNCQTVNPDGAKFCLNCGTPLTQACPNCAASVTAGARFCSSCGFNLGAIKKGDEATLPKVAISPAPDLRTPASALDRYLPAALRAKLESARTTSNVESERRVVTMLFCDVKGSTAAASQMDPEEWAEIMNGAFEPMIRPVYQFEGTVARLTGDGLLAFFGAPIAHEDDPQRAVLAGLAIQEGMKGYAEAIKRTWGLEMGVRVGINTGLVVVGAVGSDLRMEYTALGDAINLAARMEQTAPAGAVQIAEPTYRLVAPLFDFEVVEGLELKGKAEPVRAYRVLGRKEQPGALRGIAGLDAPLIGREREMDMLHSAIAGLQAGQGSIVSVMGEAGLGKSRLVTELRQAVGATPGGRLQWLEGRSLSYETSSPYAPFIDLLSDCFGLRPSQAEPEKYDLVFSQVEALFPGRGDEMAPFLATLLNVQPTGLAAERVKFLEPPMLRMHIFTHVAAFFERLAHGQPLVLFFDDLHWIDATSLELLESLLPITDRKPLLIVTAFRPRRQESAWRLHERGEREFGHRYTPIFLSPLDEEQSRQLVASLLHIEDLPEKVRRLILEKAEGNPFFVEEVIRSLLDGGLVVRDNDHWRATRDIVHIAVPDTLIGVITARLDRLDESARQAAQAASVIGREFSFEVLADIFDASESLEPGLENLQRRELIRAKSSQPGRIYTFKHVLTQEAAYGSVLLSKRRDLHLRVARSLQRRQPDAAADIARHFLEARYPAQAVPYLVEAGDRAARSYSATEATAFYSQALELRHAVESLVPVQRAYEGLGGVLSSTGQIPQALELYYEMLKLGEDRDNVSMQISALNKLATVSALMMGDFPQAEAYLEQADHLARANGVKDGIAEGSIIRCQICTARADFGHVVETMNEVVQIGQEMGNKQHIAMGLEHISSSLMFLTRFDEALTKAQEALAMAREIDDRQHEAWILCTTLPICYARQGAFAQARIELAEGLKISDRIGALMPQIYGNWFMGELMRWQGLYEDSLFFAGRSLDLALPMEPFMPFATVLPLGSLGSIYLEISPQFFDRVSDLHLHALRLLENPAGVGGGGTAWADLGWCAMKLGDLQLASEAFEKGLHHPTMFMLLERSRYLAGAALLAVQRDQLDEALRLAAEGRTYAEERGMQNHYPLLALTMGRVRAARGETDQALIEFDAACELAQALSMRPIIWQAQAAAADLLAGRGQPSEAANRLQAARAVIHETAALISDPALREMFLEGHLPRLGGSRGDWLGWGGQIPGQR